MRRILVDGDAAGHRDLLIELAMEYGAELHWVNNTAQKPPVEREGLKLFGYLADKQSQSADVIVMNLAAKDDLVVTGDLGLAAVVLSKGAVALSPRGHWYYQERLAQQLEQRHLLAERRRAGGRMSGGPKAAKRVDELRFEEEVRKALEGDGAADDRP
jgi:uncharacterized protein YaiI (UPF0178 family)